MRREKEAGLLYRRDYTGIDPRKFVKSTPNDGLAAGLGHAIFRSGSVFLHLGFSHMEPE